MFAGDVESECSFDFDDQQMAPVALTLPCQAWRKSRKNPQGKQHVKLVDQLLTSHEREFGWSASPSGIRGPSEEQARRELEFIKRSKQQPRNRRSSLAQSREQVLEQDDELERFLSLPDPPAYDIGAVPQRLGLNHPEYHYNRHGQNQTGHHDYSPDRSLVSRRLHSDEVQSGVPSCILRLPQPLSDCKQQNIHGNRDNRPIPTRGKQCVSTPPAVSERRLAQSNSWMDESDEALYNASRKLDNSVPIENSQDRSPKSFAADRENRKPGGLWVGLMRRLSRLKTKPVTSRPKQGIPHRMDERKMAPPAPPILSHQMVGAFSPFPMRPPLSTGSGRNPAVAAGGMGSAVKGQSNPSSGAPTQNRARKFVPAAGLC